MSAASSPPPSTVREVHCAEAIAWLRERGCVDGACAVTSLPDVSEVNLSLESWRAWFLGAVRAVIDAVPPAGAAVFFQSDIRHDGRWVDKGALVTRAAEDAGAGILFHKIVSRRPPGIVTTGRPGFTHLIAVSRELRCAGPLAIPDIIVDAGRQPWVRAMGVKAAAHAVRFARDDAAARVILDPFCGVGTVLAVANRLGLPAVGVERSAKRCERARELTVGSEEV
jgi:hypothetical protein